MKKIKVVLMLVMSLLLSSCYFDINFNNNEDDSQYYEIPIDFEYDGPTFPSVSITKGFWNNTGGSVKVTLDSCTDGDTARFVIDGNVESVRFFNIDTQESTRNKEEWGKPASVYTCNVLKNAKELYLQGDPGDGPRDKYERVLAWVWADGELVQYHLVSLGLAEVKYLYGADTYTDVLQAAQAKAETEKIGQWGDLLDPYWDYENNKPKGW